MPRTPTHPASASRPSWPAVRAAAAGAVLLVGLLAGCSDSPDTETPVVEGASGAPATTGSAGDAGTTGDAGTDRPDGSGTDGPDGSGTDGPDGSGGDPDAAGDTEGPGSGGNLSATVQSDGTILVDGDHASFLMPSQNVACVLRPDQVLCQIDGKTYDAKDRDITPEAFEGCTPSTADAMSVGGGADPAWACLPYDLRPGTDVTQGGSWAGPGIGATTPWEGATVAVLPYGTTLRLGNVSCTSDRMGVDCTDLVSGHGFQLARERYTTH